MNIEDELSGLTADLVESASLERVLVQIFGLQSGTWTDLSEVLDSLEDVGRQYADIKQEYGPVYVCWLDFPMSENGDGFSTIIFYSERLHWTNLALYNKARLFRRVGLHHDR